VLFPWERSENDITHIILNSIPVIIWHSIKHSGYVAWNGIRHDPEWWIWRSVVFKQLFWRINRTGNICVRVVCVQFAFLRRLSSVLVTSTYCLTRTSLKYLRLKRSCRAPLLWSSVLHRLSDWTFDALDSRVDGLRLSEYLSVYACVCLCRGGRRWRRKL